VCVCLYMCVCVFCVVYTVHVNGIVPECCIIVIRCVAICVRKCGVAWLVRMGACAVC
jgi:hypothetical protein